MTTRDGHREVRAQQGTTALLRAAHDDLRRFLARRLQSADDAEEIAQESFARLYRSEAAAQLPNPRPFLFRIAQNLLIDRARRDRVSPIRTTLAPDSPLVQAHPSDAASPEQQLAARDELNRTLCAIEDLPPACRTAFRMWRFDEASHAEIAAALGVSTSMVEKHLARAMRLLKTALIDEEA